MGNDKHSLNLQIAAVGWEHRSWLSEFYPHDLPAQWRLTYYANEYRTVLVPASAWQAESSPDVAQWYEDVPKGFCFYVCMSVNASEFSDEIRICQSLSALKEKLAGVILVSPQNKVLPLSIPIKEYCPDVDLFYPLELSAGHRPITYWSNAQGHTVGLLECVPGPDLKKLRLLIEQFIVHARSEEATLFLVSDSRTLSDACTIAQLLGY